MWQITLILSSLIIMAQPENIENFFNQVWTYVATYPVKTYSPLCIQFMLDKAPGDIDCICIDGNNATLVEYSYVKNEVKTEVSRNLPMIAIDVPNEVALDVNCTCGQHHYTSRVALRSVKNNYLVMYVKKADYVYTEAEPNRTNVAARKIPKHVDLAAALKSIEDLKNRQGAEICTSDGNAGLRTL